MNQKFSPAAFILAGIRQKPGRNLATVFCFAFIAANIFSAQYLIAGAAESLDQGVSRMGADLLVIPSRYAVLAKGIQMGPATAGTIIRAEPSTVRINISVMDMIGNVPDVTAMSPQLYVASLAVPAFSPLPVAVYGIDPVTDFTVQPWLQEPLKNSLGHGEVIVGNAVKGDIGSKTLISGTTYTIAGRLDPTQSPVDNTVFMTLDDAYTLAATPGFLPPSAPAILPGSVNAILVRADPRADQALVAARIQQPFSYEYLRVLEKHFTLQPASQAVQGLQGLLNIISFVVILAALPLIALIAAMVAHERQREIGLLLSMGAKKKLVFFLIMAESLVLAGTGGAAGTGLAALFLLNGGIILPGSFLQGFPEPSVAAIGVMAAMALGIVILIGSIASLWPAYQSSRMNPWDAIRIEE
jgi:putative ABC transport system permease protein